MKKQYIPFVLSCFLSLTFLFPLPASAADSSFSLSSSASLLGCTENEQILYEQNTNLTFSFHNLSYLLAALVAEDYTCPDEQITVPAQAASLPSSASRIYLEAGEQICIQDCLAAMLLADAEDAGTALALHIAGSQKRFAKMLNEKAASLGAVHSRIIYQDDQTAPLLNTTAADLFIIAKAFWQIPHLRAILRTPQYKIAPTNLMPDSRFYNRTHPLTLLSSSSYDEHCLGGLYGYSLGGNSYILSFAEKDGLPLIAITVGSDSISDSAADHALLLAYGYENFSLITYPLKNMLISKLPVYQGKNKLGYTDIFAVRDLYYVTSVWDASLDLQTKLLLPSSLPYPSYAQSSIGYIQYYKNEHLIASIPCMAFSDPLIQNIAFLQSVSAMQHMAALSYAPPVTPSLWENLFLFIIPPLLLVSYFFYRKHTLF